MRRVLPRTLKKKLRKWQTALKLDGWDIKIKYKHCGKDDAAEVEFCEPVERTAVINISPNYYNREGYNVSWTLDELIIHELIHVVLWEPCHSYFSSKIRGSQKFEDFEEFVCFHFAKIIGDIRRRSSKRRQ